jgi:hypothetical protein
LPICLECGDVIKADDDSVEVKIISTVADAPEQTVRVHTYRCLLTFRLKHRRQPNGHA